MLRALDPMIPLAAADPAERRNLRNALRLYPWLWPSPDDAPQAFERAQVVAERDSPPELRPGVVPLLTWSEAGVAALWALDLHSPSTELPSAGFRPEVDTVWRDALVAVSRSAPALWAPLRRDELPRRVARLACTAAAGQCATPPTTLTDSSFGLAFALAILSDALQIPLRPDVAAIACCDAGGVLRPAREPEKLALLARAAPTIRTVLAARGDGALATWSQGRCIERGAHFVDLLPAAGLDPMRRLDEELRGTDEQRRRIADGVFETILRGGLTDWKGVSAAIENLLEPTRGLGGIEREKVELARVIALRHQAKPFEAFRIPSVALLSRLHRPVREKLFAHVVQSAADENKPPRDEALALALGVLQTRDPHDLTDGELKILGARARLHAARHEVDACIADARSVTRAYLDRGEFDEVSRGLSILFRIAGGARRDDVVTEAEDFWHEAAPHLEREVDALYIRVARGFARWATGRATRDDDLLPLLEITALGRAPVHLRASAVRAALLVVNVLEPGANMVEVSRRLHGQLVLDAANAVRWSRLLEAVDRACERADAADAERAVASLAEAAPALLVDALTATAHLAPLERADRVRRLYPY